MGKGIAWQAMHNNPVSNAFIVHDLKVISETAERLESEKMRRGTADSLPRRRTLISKNS